MVILIANCSLNHFGCVKKTQLPHVNKFMVLVLSETIFMLRFATETVAVAQLVRASDCGSEGRGFETPQSPR